MDAGDATAEAFLGHSTPGCSCDCCQAAERLPSEVQAVGLSSSSKLGFKCIVTVDYPTESCPSQCRDLSPEGALDTSANNGNSPTDYPRFCLNRCMASTPSAGTICAERASPTNAAFGAGAGGDTAGTEDTVIEEPEWKKDIDAKKKQQAEEADDEKKAIVVTRNVNWDMRKLVAERLRAEAGASMSHGAATGERVRLNQHAAEQSAKMLKKVKEAIGPLETSIDESKTKAKQEADKAVESGKRAKMLLKGAKASLPPVLKSVKQITIAAIKAETVQAAADEASAFAARMGWNEPDNYRKILANRASEPYLKTEVTATARVSDYKAYAKGILGQANAVQAQAQGLSAHATAMEAQGDMIGAVAARHEIKLLLQRAKDLEGEAKKYWQIAEDADKAVGKWQNAAYAAANYAIQEYDIGRAPPKGLD